MDIAYCVSFKSFSLIHPAFLSSSHTANEMTAGRTNEITMRPIQSIAPMDVFKPPATSFTHPVYTPICPTKPHVPIPLETAGPFICRRKTQVARGPVMALATIGGIQVFGFLIILGICSMLVPRPCETRPPTPFSFQLITAKPIIWLQQPATAAPPARPVKPKAAQIAALEIGRVKAIPTRTETMMR